MILDAEEAGVICILTGTDRKENKKIDRFIREHKAYGTAGIHPHNADAAKQEDFELIEKLVTENKKIVAIGECGLDYDAALQKILCADSKSTRISVIGPLYIALRVILNN